MFWLFKWWMKKEETYASNEVGVDDGNAMRLEKIGDSALPR